MHSVVSIIISTEILLLSSAGPSTKQTGAGFLPTRSRGVIPLAHVLKLPPADLVHCAVMTDTLQSSYVLLSSILTAFKLHPNCSGFRFR